MQRSGVCGSSIFSSNQAHTQRTQAQQQQPLLPPPTSSMPGLAAMLTSSPKSLGAAKAALLVIAHPDDESMFFAPALQHLRRAGAQLWVLCLSKGAMRGCIGRRAQPGWRLQRLWQPICCCLLLQATAVAWATCGRRSCSRHAGCCRWGATQPAAAAFCWRCAAHPAQKACSQVPPAHVTIVEDVQLQVRCCGRVQRAVGGQCSQTDSSVLACRTAWPSPGRPTLSLRTRRGTCSSTPATR